MSMAIKAADTTKVGNDAGAGGATETTPLLGTADGNSQLRSEIASPPDKADQISDERTEDVSRPDQGERPVPYTQIFLLCFSAIAEPVAYFAIFPIVSEMVLRTGSLAEEDIGFWTGLIESLFSLVQMTLLVLYGRAADKLGRKPILVFSLVGIGITTALFGMSQAIWQMIMFRCLCGMFAGSVVTIRTMLSENTTKQTQGTAFSWFAFVRNLGIFIGPLIGGGLANPVDQFPNVFGNSTFLKTFPYALSTYTASGVVFLAALSSWLFIKETLRGKTNDSLEPERPMSSREILSSPGVGAVLFFYGYVSMLGLFYTAMAPVFMYTSVGHGGFGFSDQQIAYFLAVAGASQAAWMLFAFPTLQRKFGTGNVMRGCAFGWFSFMGLYPLLNELLRHDLDTVFWVLAPTTIILGSAVAMGFTCVQLFVNDISPSPVVLGTLNAFALTITSAIRAFIPVLATSLYAFGIKWGFLDGHLAWLIMIVLGAILIGAMAYLPAAAEGRIAKHSVRNDA